MWLGNVAHFFRDNVAKLYGVMQASSGVVCATLWTRAHPSAGERLWPHRRPALPAPPASPSKPRSPWSLLL